MANKASSRPQLTVRVAQETYDQLVTLCKVSHLSQTAHLQSALNEYLPKELARYNQPRQQEKPV